MELREVGKPQVNDSKTEMSVSHDAKATKKYKTRRGPTKNDQRRHVSTQRIKNVGPITQKEI